VSFIELAIISFFFSLNSMRELSKSFANTGALINMKEPSKTNKNLIVSPK
jgi:hypothetical protein